MRTKEQLRDIIAQRLEAKLFHVATFSDLVVGISAGGNPVDRIKITVDSGLFSGQISAQWST